MAAMRGMPIYGVLCEGERFDCGTNADLQKANIRLSLYNHPELRQYAKKILDMLD